MDRWIDTLDSTDRRFLELWAPRVREYGSATECYYHTHRGDRRTAKGRATRLMRRLLESEAAWQEGGGDNLLPDLSSDWIIEQLTSVSSQAGVSDRDRGYALAQLQAVSPEDVRSYPDWVVVGLTPEQWQDKPYRADLRERGYVAMSPAQWTVFSSEARFRIVVAGRRWGKTVLGVLYLITLASQVPGATCYYLGKTRRQVRKVAWRKVLKQLLKWEYVAKMSESEMVVELTNGSEIRFDGVEEPDNLRGPGLHGLVNDEFASWKNGQFIWQEVLRPMLGDFEGGALFVGTPAGYNHFRDVYLLGLDPTEPEWASWSYTTIEGGNVPSREIESAKRHTDPRSFRQEWEASFEQLANQVYDFFDRETHVREVEDRKGDLLVGIDFNLDPMTAIVAQVAAGDCEVLEAVLLPVSNTEELLDEVERRYPDRTFRAYPDPSGRRRQTSAGGETDFTIIDKRPRWTVDPAMKRSWSIPMADKINNVQANLRDATGTSHVIVDATKGKPLIDALEGLVYKQGTAIPDKVANLDHPADGFGYLLWGAFNRFRKKAELSSFSI